jgi:hypothetical protein
MHRQYILCLETGIHLPNCHEGSDEERGRNQQHDSQRHFDGDQQHSCLTLPHAGACAIAVLLQRSAEVRLRRSQGRNESKQNARENR